MMSETLRNFRNFFVKIQPNIYLEGQVPNGAEFPYATFTCCEGRFGEPVAAHVTGWYRSGSANANAAAFLNAIAALVPESGVWLESPASKLLIHRATDFLTIVRDGDAIGGQARMEIRSYNAH